jgi:glycosyltransferase involved in cell wall biosynthesis
VGAIRLAIVNTHPIQYYSPLFRKISTEGGVDIHVFYTWRGLSEEGYDPGFEQSLSWDIPLLEGYDHTFVENTASDPGTHHFRGIVAPDLIPNVAAWDPDAVLVFGWNYQAHLRALRYFHGRIPVLFRGDSTLLDESPGPRKWLRRVFLRWVYRYVDVALYVGQNNRSYFEAHGFKKEELAWVPHAVENERFAEARGAEREAAQWRREIGIPERAPVILFAGKVESKKAPDVLLEAFLKLKNEKVHLVIAGSGPMQEDLKTRAGKHPRIHFLGFQNQSRMPVVYRLGDVFVLPSRGPNETWGLAVNEAMVCGLPVVVSSRVGCAPDLVTTDNGAVVSPDDPIALRDALDTLMSDSERLREMGRRSAERIKIWSIENAASRTAEAIKSVVAPDAERSQAPA